MNKIFEQIWKDYKKANAVSKQRMLEKYGFSSEEEFQKHLGVTAPKKAVAKKTTKTVKTTSKKVSSKKHDDLVDECFVQPLDMVVAFDTTGSMRAYIGAVRQNVEETINEMFDKTPNLRMKLVAFGDYCDPENIRYQQTSMTADRETLIEFVRNAKDTCGGDGDEFYEYVIKRVIEETDWRKDAQKSFLLIGDDVPHEVGYSYGKIIKHNQIDWKVEASKAATRGIQIDTLRIHSHIGWYEELSTITNGVCMDFKTASKTAHVVTGLAYARGSKSVFTATMDSVMASGDEELIGAYKTMSSLL